jgi:hypothetical protein
MSTENSLHLAKGFNIPVSDYATQGNAILGIRDAGKTYTAMKAAEELLENNIPIIVYDPVGVWKNLKIGTGKHKGYPIVVAGGEGADIHLTVNNAVDIVRAAMKENVSLVIDLYSPELINKSTWIRIVQETIDVLMYENKAYGARHIFIEEAAEFIPQRIQPQQSRVYASIERLARMGRNARLGLTIINQRAEEVNKAILEICAFSLLHKQVGKNSLKSIQQWLDLRQLDGVPAIIKSLPTLQQGECWAIGHLDQVKRIKIDPRNTYHPNPRSNADAAVINKLAMDVTGFVSKMNKQLQAGKEVKAAKIPAKQGPVALANTQAIDKLKAENETLKTQLAQSVSSAKTYKKLYEAASHALTGIINQANKIVGQDVPIQTIIPEIRFAPAVTKPVSRNITQARTAAAPVNGAASLGKCSREVIRFLATYPERSFSKAQVAIATNYSPGGGGFLNSLGELGAAGFIIRDGKLQVNNAAINQIIAIIGEVDSRAYDISTYKNNLGKCEREIYEVLLARPDTGYTKDQIAGMTETVYSPSGGGFLNSLGRLNKLELIKRENGLIMLNPELLELM